MPIAQLIDSLINAMLFAINFAQCKISYYVVVGECRIIFKTVQNFSPRYSPSPFSPHFLLRLCGRLSCAGFFFYRLRRLG